jgi:mono/diheme cytochrome c family protein
MSPVRPTFALVPALALLLGASCARSDPPAAAGAPTANPADALALRQLAGKRVFDRTCATCHQANGQGVPGVFPPLAGSELLLTDDPKRPILIVLHGLSGPVEVRGQTYNAVMPAQGAMLGDQEIADALTYARTSWGNQAPAVDPAAVAALRRSHPRPTFWTWEELRQQ